MSSSNNVEFSASQGGEAATRVEGVCVGDGDPWSTEMGMHYSPEQRVYLSEIIKWPSSEVSPKRKDEQTHIPPSKMPHHLCALTLQIPSADIRK